ncbi:MAG: aminopeptidase N [Deltaproteobacteria bacterium]|nr:aminopeptidase N [Deltaproteobacteria bacterium]
MLSKEPKRTYLKEYQPPAYLIPEVELHFELFEEYSSVQSKLHIVKNQAVKGEAPLKLNGEKLTLVSVKLNGKMLSKEGYHLTDTHLTLLTPPADFVLEIETEIKPQENKELEGLYKTGGIFCTQNEAEGFRKITYFLDRPDVMSRYTTTITAERLRYPVLLSNGNRVDAGNYNQSRHFVTWEDPFPKPCYLFALVAGDLACVRDQFVTQSGRPIDLRIYVEPGNEGNCAHAMASLKKAMKWDEETYGLECDLDTYMIAAVKDFNFGAMENKGLNIFNSLCVLADPKIATDEDYEWIERIVGHEYFHNWTGNRVACRDWFQLTLKEGFTIFREQEFSADMASRPLKRILNVRGLRESQFPEDSGPNAHPIRPDFYIEINNFYTPTVYTKGAEVIRMVETLLGKETFRKGVKVYFDLCDGKGVTAEDFIRAMEIASGCDLSQMKRWYNQAGTPICSVTTNYDAERKSFEITVEQKPPAVAKGEAEPFYFPLTVGLLDREGMDIPLVLEGEEGGGRVSRTKVLPISDERETFRFKNVSSRPVPSLLRNFSAPVILEYAYTEEDLQFLLAHDSNLFNRWEAGQQLAVMTLERLISAHQEGNRPEVAEPFFNTLRKLIGNHELDLAFKGEALILPTERVLTERMALPDFDAVFMARHFLMKSIAGAFEELFLTLYKSHHEGGPYSSDPLSSAKRRLKNVILGYLVLLEKKEYLKLALDQFRSAVNMTDKMASLEHLSHTMTEECNSALNLFYQEWRENPLVIVKWFEVQARSKRPDTLLRVKDLEKNPSFDRFNPNHMNALFDLFAANLVRFHDASGEGYEFIAERVIEIDQFSPKQAGKLAKFFSKYSKVDPNRRGKMRYQLEKILARNSVSPDVFEIVSNILKPN